MWGRCGTRRHCVLRGVRSSLPYSIPGTRVTFVTSPPSKSQTLPSPHVIFMSCHHERSEGSAFAASRQESMAREFRFYAYIMASKSRRIYTGVTNNIERRVKQHKANEIEGFTVQNQSAGVLRGLSLRGQRHSPREGNQGMGSH